MPSKLLIAIPNYGNNAPGLFLDSMVRLMTHLARKFGPGEIDYMRVGLMYIDIARNMIWDEARKRQTDALLCLDDDMTFTPQTFEAVWNTPGDVVSGLYFQRRQPPTAPCMYQRMPNGHHSAVMAYPKDAVIDVDAVGFGFVLIRKPVIDALEHPFTTRTAKGEDIAFCENAKAAGFSVKVNTAAKVGHILTVPLIIEESNAGPEFG
jgi:hypothetical protein